MTSTTHFNLQKYVGTDYFNPLTVENGNADRIDAQMYANMVHGAGDATELVSGTVHAITRVSTAVPLFHFTATGRWNVGDTMTVNGVQVSVLSAAGTALPDGAYVIGSEVIGYLRDTLVTIVNAGGATGSGDIDADTLGGHEPSYFATAQSVTNLGNSKADKSVGVSALLNANNWTAYGSKFRQTVAVSGVTTSNNIMVGPAPANVDEYAECNVYAVSQGVNTVTFECDTVPTNSIYANVIILG